MKERTPVHNSGMQAIRTTYLMPTDTEGAHIKAEVDNGGVTQADSPSLTAGYDHALDGPGNHAAAAVGLVNHMKSHGRWAEDIGLVQGATSNGYVFVLTWGEEE